MEQIYKKRKFSEKESDDDEYLEELIEEFIDNQPMSFSDDEFEFNDEFNDDEFKFESLPMVNTMNNNNCICSDPNCGGCEISKKEKKYILDYWSEGDGYDAGYYLGEIKDKDVYYYPYLVIPDTYDVIGVFEDASGDVFNGVEMLSKFIPISEEIAQHILKQGTELELWQEVEFE